LGRIKAAKNHKAVRSRVRSNQNVRLGNIGGDQQRVQILSDGLGGPRKGARIAPSSSGAIVPAGFCKRADFQQQRGPAQARPARRRFQNHCGTALARAVHLHVPSADIDGHAYGRNLAAKFAALVALIKDAHYQCGRQQDGKTYDDL
jgi:hypothetical protein